MDFSYLWVLVNTGSPHRFSTVKIYIPFNVPKFGQKSQPSLLGKFANSWTFYAKIGSSTFILYLPIFVSSTADLSEVPFYTFWYN